MDNRRRQQAADSLRSAEPSLLTACGRRDRKSKTTEELRIAVEEYAGHPYVSIRMFYRGSDGVFRPSMKGVSVRVCELPAVVKALAEARSMLTGKRSNQVEQRSFFDAFEPATS